LLFIYYTSYLQQSGLTKTKQARRHSIHTHIHNYGEI